MPPLEKPLPAVGISSCLMGHNVRYNAELKHDPALVAQLAKQVRLIPVCPEVGCGLPVPREPMRLEGDPAAPRLVVIATRQDLTAQMLAYCERTVEELAAEDLAGFVFKARSPSSGLREVPVYHGDEIFGRAAGLFAAAVIRRFPGLPVEEEERLQTPEALEAFLTAILRYRPSPQ